MQNVNPAESQGSQGAQGASSTGGPVGDLSEYTIGKGATLNDLRNLLIQHMGEEKGQQMYNRFIISLAMGFLAADRQAAQQADQATKQMGQQNP